ncbi:MAG: S9 family peptidase [Lewinella sp.]|nr:S9 family peptidase [Lewinella sp.]
MLSPRFLLLPLLSILLLTACQEAPSEAAKAVPQYTIEQFMDNVLVYGSSFSPNGETLLVTSNRSGILNAYTIPFAGGDLTPLTQSDSSSARAIGFFPDDERILFTMDDNGDEVYQLYVRNTDGTVQRLTDAEGARASAYGISHDAESFYIGWSKRDPRFMDVYEVPIATLEPQLLYEMESGDNFGGISPDKRFMAIVRPINTNDTEMLLYDFTTQELTTISGEQGAYSPADFSADGQYLYYTTNAGNEFSYLRRYNLTTGEHEDVQKADWDIAYAYFSHDGKYRVTGINADAKTVIEVINTETGEAVDFPDFGERSVAGVNISRDEQRMAFYVSGSASPSDLYVYDFATGESRQLTENLNTEINADDLVQAQVVRFPSFDGVEVPAIYYKPKQASADNPVPALVWVHGGPGGQSRQSYSPLLQYLVNHGYAVLAVNNRGSSGYGKTFFRMDDQRHGEEDLKDCIAGKNWLAEQGYINASAIGILGGSYGGFMVMRAMTHTPTEFAVGVDIFGVTNWVRTLRSIPPWWESFKDALYEEMGDPYSADSVRHYEISPVFHGDKVQNPVMVLQGGQDPRVLQVESDEMVAAIREQGVPVEYVLFEDEGHGFVKKENEIEGYGKILTFLNTYLKPTEELAN